MNFKVLYLLVIYVLIISSMLLSSTIQIPKVYMIIPGGWVITGRQEGINSWDIVNFKGEESLHLHHEKFSEIVAYKWLEIPDEYRGKTIGVVVRIAGDVQSSASSHSDFFALAAFDVQATYNVSSLNKWGHVSSIYWVRAAWDTSDYHEKHFLNMKDKSVRKYIRLSDKRTWKNVRIEIPYWVTEKARYMLLKILAYGSGWPYSLKADIWISTILIFPE